MGGRLRVASGSAGGRCGRAAARLGGAGARRPARTGRRAALQSSEAHVRLAGQRRANAVVSTGTASGKSLCFTLPTLHTFTQDQHARALFLYHQGARPDQVRKLTALLCQARCPPSTTVTPRSSSVARSGNGHHRPQQSDMLHWACCRRTNAGPSSSITCATWCSTRHTSTRCLRLARRPGDAPPAALCTAYGSSPQFVLASATIANRRPRRAARRPAV